MRLFGRDADFKASWDFSHRLQGLSKKNFGKEGTSSFGSGFILDHEVMTQKFSEYAKAMEEVVENVSGEVEYFVPEEREQDLTEIANEMDVVSNIPQILDGTWDKRDRIAKEIIEAISKDNDRKEINSRKELVRVTEEYAVVSANLVFEKDSQVANLKFKASNIDSYLDEKSESSKQETFEVKLYGDNEFRRQLTKTVPDLAGRWSDWDLARNKLKESQLYGKIRDY